MNARERFKKTMRCLTVDRVPYLEEGIRSETLRAWRRQGLRSGVSISDLFPTDSFSELAPNVDPLPEFRRWPEDSADLEKLKKRLNPKDKRRWPEKRTKLKRIVAESDQILFLRVHRGFFLTMGVYKWRRFDRVMSLLIEKPRFVKNYMEIQGRFTAELADDILSEIKIDAAIFSEPIGGNEGPLISPNMYESFVLESYKPLMDVLKKHAVETIIFRTYANARILIPEILPYGFNCLWACETNAASMDYRSIRREFGRDLRLIGGIDLDALRNDKAAIRKEVEDKVPALLDSGGYVPLADGRVRADVTFENYCFYRELLGEIIEKHHKSLETS